MVVDDRSRHELYRRLEEVLGLEAATTLIEHLPPVGWADVATKQDLASLEQRVELRFDRMELRFEQIDGRFAASEANLGFRFEALESGLRATFEHELRAQAITLFIAQVTVVLTMAVLAFSLVRFT